MVAVKIPGPESVNYVDPAKDPGEHATPDQFGAQVGQAIADVGQSISYIGRVAEGLQKRRQGDTDHIANERWKLESNDYHFNSFNDAQKNMQPGAKDFYSGLRSQWTGSQQKRLEEFQKKYNVSKDGAKQLLLTDLQLQNDYSHKAVAVENNEAVRFLGETTWKNIGDASAGAAAHGHFADLQKTIDSNIAATGGVMGPEERAKLTEGANKLVIGAFTEYANNASSQTFADKADVTSKWNAFDGELNSLKISDGEKDLLRQKYSNEFHTSYYQQHPNDVPHPPLGGQAASGDAVTQASGVIKHFEGFRSNAYHDVNAPRAGYGSDTVTHPDGTFERVTRATTVTQADAERDLNRRVGVTQQGIIGKVGAEAWNRLNTDQKSAFIDLAYNYGSLPDRVVPAVKGGDANDMAQAVGRLGMDNGGINRERRATEAAMIAGRQQTGGNYTTPRAIAEGMPPPDAKTWMGIQKEAGQEVKAGIERAVPDIITSYANAGAYKGPEPTLSDYTFAYGQEQGAKEFKDFTDAKQTATAVNSFQTMAGDDIAKTLTAARQNIPAGPGAKQAQDDYDAMARAASQVMEARGKAPADYVVQTFPDVQKAWQAYVPSDPATANAAISRTLNAERGLGIPEYATQPMPKIMAERAAAEFNDTTKPIEKRADALTTTVLQTKDVEQQQAIFHQLVAAGVPASTEAAVEAAARGDLDASRRLYAAAVTPANKYPIEGTTTEQTTTANAISDAINKKLIAHGSVGEAYYGLQYDEPGNSDRAIRDTGLMETAARINMAQGSDSATAVDRATKDLFGDVVRMTQPLPNGGGIDVLVPKSEAQTSWWKRTEEAFGFGKSPLMAGFERAMPQVRRAVEADAARGMEALNGKLVAPDSQLAVANAVLQGNTEKVLAEGVFRNYGYGNQFAFYDTYTNKYVSDGKGGTLTFTFDQLATLGTTGISGDAQRRQFNPAVKPMTKPTAANLTDPKAMAALNMSPGEQHLYQHHLDNLTGGKGVQQPDGSISTIENVTVERDGRTYVIPTVWDGAELTPHDAVARAGKEGWKNWPSYPTEDEANKRYDQLHAVMGEDVHRYLSRQ